MYFCYIVFVVLFIPLINGNSLSTPSVETHLKLLNVTSEPHDKDINTKEAVITEGGGSVEPDPLAVTLPKENHANLINLDKEMGKTKVKSIVPRKGVDYSPIEDSVTSGNFTKERIDSTTKILDQKPTVSSDQKVKNESNLIKPSTKSDLTNSTKNTIENTKTTSANIEVKVPKKPQVLSAEAILETDRKASNDKVGSSSKPIVSDQLPSPNVKHQPQSSSSHPGMIMPIVITMLVVPMFAVLGYMALRRGQEAWKNRHYKRMDFLLDGMYND